MDGGRTDAGAVLRQGVSTGGAGARDIFTRFHKSPYAMPIEAVSFWLAVLLPAVYLPLLLLDFPTAWGFTAFLALVVAHLVTLSLGHAYHR